MGKDPQHVVVVERLIEAMQQSGFSVLSIISLAADQLEYTVSMGGLPRASGSFLLLLDCFREVEQPPAISLLASCWIFFFLAH